MTRLDQSPLALRKPDNSEVIFGPSDRSERGTQSAVDHVRVGQARCRNTDRRRRSSISANYQGFAPVKSRSRARELGVADVLSGGDCCAENSCVDSAVASVYGSNGSEHVGCFKEPQGVGLIPET